MRQIKNFFGTERSEIVAPQKKEKQMEGMLLFKRERLLPGIQKRVLISSVCSYFSQVQNNNDDDNDNDDDDDEDSHNADRSKKLTLCFGAS